jgi:exodeoxyribonuclease-3
MAFTIAAWNVNSILARLPTALKVFEEVGADVWCLQEIKCEDDRFPRFEIEAMGFNVATFGQKSYNGVAILSKHRIEEHIRGLPGLDHEQARYIEAVVAAPAGPFRVASIYAPNGNPVGTDKFKLKLDFMAALAAHARELLKLEERFILAGDYNVIPRNVDCYDPGAWQGDALFQPEARAAYRTLLNLGLSDAFLQADGAAHKYTFWDYQAGAWQKDHGIRIDHLLLSPQAADRLERVDIFRKARGMEKASDHVPISATFTDRD